MGSYNYTAALCPAASGGGPHALHCIAGTVMGLANPSFAYDANGNLTAGLGRSLTYTSFNLPATVSAPNNLVPGTTTAYTYVYNAEHERVKHIIQRSDGTFTTIYLHPAGKGELLYEKEMKPTVTEHKHYLSAGGQLIGVYLTRSDATSETRYFHRDQLGSLTLITNASGAQLERLAYEAYGKRRNPNGTDDPANTLYGITTDRGFTAHGHLDEIALIHMNGRIYDPLLGKFMTSDPYIQAPALIVSYNRYAYGFDNPLSGVDPSGYSWCGICDDVVDAVTDTAKGVGNAVGNIVHSDVGRVAAVAAVGWFTYGAVSSWLSAGVATTGTSTAFVTAGSFLETEGVFATSLTWSGGAIAGAGAGFTTSLVASRGDFNAGLNGAFSGALFGGIDGYYGNAWGLQRVASSAVAGGVAERIQGGNFKNGFLFAGTTASFRYLYNKTVEYDVTFEPGGNAVEKEPTQMPVKGANNIGTQGGPVDPNGVFNEGGIVSRALNNVPGINAVAGMHDVFQVTLDQYGQAARNAPNVPGMLPAAVITYGALLNGMPGQAVRIDRIERTKRRQ